MRKQRWKNVRSSLFSFLCFLNSCFLTFCLFKQKMKKQIFFPTNIWIIQKNKMKFSLFLFLFFFLVCLAKLNNWMNEWCTDPPAPALTLHVRRWTQHPSLWMRNKDVIRNKHLHNIALSICIIMHSYIYFVPAALNFVFIFMFYYLLWMWTGCVTVWNVLGNDTANFTVLLCRTVSWFLTLI